MASDLTASWVKIASSTRLQRSSQCLSIIGNDAIIFGGEVKPREPVDNKIDVVNVGKTGTTDTLSLSGEVPSARVGSASTTLDGQIYLFSGRGGIAMAPIEENGALWTYCRPSGWSLVTPKDPPSPFPAARSYHTMTSDGMSTLFLHAGCPESGRLSGLWSFDVQTRSWKELASAPDPPRGGTSIAYTKGKLYRMNGFDGKYEQGGAIDIYDPAENKWSSVNFTADDESGPSPRSVSVLLPVTWKGRTYLLTLFGEQDPSALGHAGAGKMKSDVWAWDITSQKWAKVKTDGEVLPEGRGWFDADVLKGSADDTIVVHGGLAEGNNRLGDVWALRAA